MREYQQWTRETAVYKESVDQIMRRAGTDDEELAKLLTLMYVGQGLVGEAGEIANVVKKFLRDGPTVANKMLLRSEIGDVMWYICRFCSEMTWDLGEIMDENKDKLTKRMAEDKIRGSGDNR